MAWCRQICICYLVIYICVGVAGFAFLLFVCAGFAGIFDFLTPPASLASILAHRIELKNLETELNLALQATSNPVNEYGIPEHKKIAQQYEEFFAEVEDYMTQDYGRLAYAELLRLNSNHAQIQTRQDQFYLKLQELSTQRRIFLTGISQRVTHTAFNTDFSALWTLIKLFQTMTNFGMSLDAEEVTVWTSTEDEACTEVLKKLSKLLNQADDLTNQASVNKYEILEQWHEESLRIVNGTIIDVKRDVRYIQLKSQRLQAEATQLFMENKQLLGKTKSFIIAAAARVKSLKAKVNEKEDVLREEMKNAVINIRGYASKSRQITLKLMSDLEELRVAIMLEEEVGDHSEL